MQAVWTLGRDVMWRHDSSFVEDVNTFSTTVEVQCVLFAIHVMAVCLLVEGFGAPLFFVTRPLLFPRRCSLPI